MIDKNISKNVSLNLISKDFKYNFLLKFYLEKEEVKKKEDDEIEIIKQKLLEKAKIYDLLVKNGGQINNTDKNNDNDDCLVNFEEKQEQFDKKKDTDINEQFHKYKIKKRK